MVVNILDERIDGLRCTEHFLHLTQIAFGLLDLCIRSTDGIEVGKLRVELFEDVLVQFELHCAALVIDGERSMVSHRLGHIVDIDVLAEYLLRVTVFVRNRCAGKADERGIGERISHETCVAFLCAQGLYVECRISILGAVRLVGHNDDVATVGKETLIFLELLNGREEDTSSLTVTEQVCEFGFGGSLLRHLTQEIRATAELTEQLVVEVVAVGDHHNG